MPDSDNERNGHALNAGEGAIGRAEVRSPDERFDQRLIFAAEPVLKEAAWPVAESVATAHLVATRSDR